MGVKLRLGVRVAFAVAVGTALLLGVVGLGSARSTDVASISIASNQASVAEGGTASFTVNLSSGAPDDLTIDYQPSNGAASSITVPAGQTSEPITVPTSDDGTPADDTTLSVQLTGVTLAGGGDATAEAAIDTGNGTATTTVVDSDWTIGSITTAPASATVSESGGNTIDFQVSLPAPAPQNHAISVQYTVSDGSAKLGKNYSITSPSNGQASGTLTFSPGQTSVDVQVKSIDDHVYGNNTTFTVSFHDSSGAAFASGATTQATGTITEADTAPYLGISGCQGGTVPGGSTATFPIVLASGTATSATASVDYKTVDDSTIGGDYTPVSGTATFAPGGPREVDVAVQTAQNPPSGSRSFHIQLSHPNNVRLLETSASCTIASTAGGGGGGGGTGNGGSVTIGTATPVAQPTSGSTPVSVPLSLTLPNPLPPTPGDVSVQWHTVDGTATAPTDYTTASGTVTWPAGTSGPNPTPVKININPDPAVTSPVTFTVAFSSTDATFVGDPTATITIVPAGSTVPMFSIADASAPSKAGSIAVPVTLTPASSQTVQVAYATANGSGVYAAVAGTNYKTTTGTLTFAPGDTTETINVPITANTSTQPSRNFTINLSNPTGGATIAVGTANVTILNDFYVALPPPIVGKGTRIQQQPTPVRTTQSTTTKTHVVLVQLYTGTGTVNAKGVASFQIGCPFLAVNACTGTATFFVGVKQKVKGKSIVKSVLVARGNFSIENGARATLNAKLTAAGQKLLATYKRMRVKVTLVSKDGAGATGTTAWLATLQAAKAKPKAKKTKAKAKKSKSNSKLKSKHAKTKHKTSQAKSKTKK